MWITLTETDVQTRLSGPELAALKSAALATGQSDPLPALVASVAREVRGYVAAGERNTLGPAGTIPDELESASLARVRYELATRLPVASLLTEARKEANRDALARLRDVAAGKFLIVQPPSEDAGPQAIAPQTAYYGGAERLEP